MSTNKRTPQQTLAHTHLIMADMDEEKHTLTTYVDRCQRVIEICRQYDDYQTVSAALTYAMKFNLGESGKIMVLLRGFFRGDMYLVSEAFVLGTVLSVLEVQNAILDGGILIPHTDALPELLAQIVLCDHPMIRQIKIEEGAQYDQELSSLIARCQADREGRALSGESSALIRSFYTKIGEHRPANHDLCFFLNSTLSPIGKLLLDHFTHKFFARVGAWTKWRALFLYFRDQE